jgi:adapter protein MecA 1/2
MKFEKLNENKLRIIVSTKDLIEQHIDFHAFMSSSLESQDIFLDMLDKAEKEVGFITKNYKVRIEAFAMNNEDFIFTVTRLTDKYEKEPTKFSKVKFRRKKITTSLQQSVYRFSSFDDFCNFSLAVKSFDIKNINNSCKSIVLYTYKNHYYLVFSNINAEYKYYKKLFSLITEFSTYVNNSELYACKLRECGQVYIKNNAIKTCLKYFSYNSK